MKPVDLFRQWMDAAHIHYKEDMAADNSVVFEIEEGYIGFMSIICFDTNGNLKSIEAYE